MTSKNLLFVASAPQNPMGIRARRLAALLDKKQGWQAEVAYLTYSDPPARSERPLGLFRLLRQILRSAYDTIYILDIGPYHAALLLVVRICCKARTVIDEGDLVGEISRKSGRSLPMSWIFHLCQALGERCADSVVVRSSYHRDLLQEAGIRSVQHIPDGIEPEVFKPRDVTALKQELDLEGTFTIGVAGSLRKPYLYGYDVVEVVHRLMDLPVKGVIIGGTGEGLADVVRRAEALGVSERIVFTGHVPNHEVPTYLSLIDVCLITRLDEPWSRVVTTGKLPEYLACECYIVASEVGEVGRIFKAHDCGYALPIGKDIPDYYDRIARHIRTLRENETRLRNVGKCGREFVLETFDYQVLAGRIEKFIAKEVEHD